MSIVTIENCVTFLAAVIGILAGLFHYIEVPRRGWLYLTAFFLAHFLSDYYWIIYTLVLHENPKVSAFTAYLGWNVAYALLLLAVLCMRLKGSERFFHPLMLLPIPINIWQFLIYIQYGGILNNIYEGLVLTVIAVLSLQSILYYIKNRKEGAHFPHFLTLTLLFVIAEYGIWTSSCFFWSEDLWNPYYWFSFLNAPVMVLFAWAIGKDYVAEGLVYHEKTSLEIRFQFLLQIIAVIVFAGGCIGGYVLASWMKNTIPRGMEGGYDIIAVVLFIISIVLVVLVLAVLFVITFRYRDIEQTMKGSSEKKRSQYSFIVTIAVTLILMIFSVVYTSRLFYRVSAEGILGMGEDTSSLIAAELSNYLSGAASAMQVTADTVDLMLQRDESQERISRFLTDQTANQAKQFDENFTGIYGLIRGEYMDGSGWIPPEDYVPESRDWYALAVERGGDVVIVPPYIDAQTHSAVITICQLISDVKDQESYKSRNVVALDVITGHIQDITQRVNINGKGYGMVIDQDGMIVAHHDAGLVGMNISEVLDEEHIDLIKSTQNGALDTVVDDEDCTIFVSPVMNQWYVLIVVSDEELFEEAHSQLSVSIIVSLIIFLLITLFYYLGYKNEQVYSRKMEELRAESQKQDYEAKMLKLEKASSDEANKAKSRFLADMSHEIRTPINAILGMNEMIQREASGSNILEYSRNIGVSGRNLLQIVNGILDFSKIEDGKMEIVPVRYSTGAFITYLINSVQERARAKDLALIADVEPGIPSELYGDDTRLSQVVNNLLTNAVKYTREGSVTLTVREEERSEGSVLLYFEVKDTGIGIKEEDMDKLFESFERLELVRNRNIEGTGLGMAITSRLLGLMDSGLKVDSVYGEGSVFSFRIWQGIENEEPLGDYRIASADDTADNISEGKLYAPSAHILVTDDTKMNLTVVTHLLKRTGIMIDTALSGEEAVRLAEKTAYDVILMDQRMPGMDGTQALREIRALENGMNENTPVICLTADAIRGARERYIAEGFTDYLTKPVDGASLERMLIDYLPEEKKGEKTLPEYEEKDDTEEKNRFEKLKEAGIDTEKGMAFCMNNEDMYAEILTEYTKDHKDRSRRLQEYYAENDWDGYMIYAHSLKSSSKTIGAMELSSAAERLETACRDKDGDLIKQDHDSVMELYGKTVAAISDCIGTDDTKDSEDDEGFFEFAPAGDDI